MSLAFPYTHHEMSLEIIGAITSMQQRNQIKANAKSLLYVFPLPF